MYSPSIGLEGVILVQSESRQRTYPDMQLLLQDYPVTHQRFGWRAIFSSSSDAFCDKGSWLAQITSFLVTPMSFLSFSAASSGVLNQQKSRTSKTRYQLVITRYRDGRQLIGVALKGCLDLQRV